MFAQKCLVDWAVHRYIMNAEGFRFQGRYLMDLAGEILIARRASPPGPQKKGEREEKKREERERRRRRGGGEEDE